MRGVAITQPGTGLLTLFNYKILPQGFIVLQTVRIYSASLGQSFCFTSCGGLRSTNVPVCDFHHLCLLADLLLPLLWCSSMLNKLFSHDIHIESYNLNQKQHTHLFSPTVIQLRQHSKKHYSPRHHQWSRHHHHRHRGTHGHHAYECGGPEMQSLINVRLYCCLTQRVNGFSSWYSFLLFPAKKDDGHITEHTSRLDNSTFSF